MLTPSAFRVYQRTISPYAKLATGANIGEVAHAVGRDARVGPKFLRASVGFGGLVLPERHPQPRLPF